MDIENKELSTIKKPNTIEYIPKEEYTRRVKEIAKCKNDIVYFAETYYRVVHPAKGLHIIKLYDIQKEFLQFLVDNNKVICCSGRQQGKSTIYCIYTLWLTCFHKDKRVMMLAQAENTALELLDRIKTGYEYLPSWLKPGCEEWNKKSIRFTNRSTISGFASSSNSSRGQSMNCLILDEFAFLPHNVEDKLFASVYPVISQDPNGKVFLISTPNGKNNLFYKIWSQANSKDVNKNLDGWKPFQMFYWQVPGHDTPEWKATQIAAIGETKFQQEYNCQFLDSDAVKKLIPDDIIERYRKRISEYKDNNINQGKELAIFSKNGTKTYTFRMYHDFNPKRTYLVSSDVAEGIGKDSSVLYVWDITNTNNIKMCAKFSDSNVSPGEFAYITFKICQMYANPFIACEANGISFGYIEQLRTTYAYDNFVRLNRANGCGIQSHVHIKSRACLWMRDMMTTMGFDFEIYDKDLVEEFASFIKADTVKYDVFRAVGDNHDDHIMTLCWGCYILNNDNIDRYYDVTEKFISSLGVEYPRTIRPLYNYPFEEVEMIKKLPQIMEFQFYKQNQSEKLIKHEENIDKLNDENSKQMTQKVEMGQNSKESIIIRKDGKDIVLNSGTYSPEQIAAILNNHNITDQDNIEAYTQMRSIGGTNFMIGGNDYGSRREKLMYTANDMYSFDDDDDNGFW